MQLRKAKTMEELLHDKGFPFHVGQLIGATEMASHWMQRQSDEDTQNMGVKLGEVVGWFFRGGTEKTIPPNRIPPSRG